MSERVIAMRNDDSPTGKRVAQAYAAPLPVYYEPDPDAPSVSEIVEILRKARCALRHDRHGDAVHAQITLVLRKLEDA